MKISKEKFLEISQKITDKDHENFFKLYSQNVCNQIESVYIDITYLQDIYLGAILEMTQDKEVYSYISSCMEDYNKRFLEGYSKYFPELNLKDEDIIEYVKDKKHSKSLIRFSPPTDMYLALKNIHKDIIIENRYKVSQKEVINKITYVVNVYPLSLDETDMKFLKERFISCLYDRHINFGVISKPSNSLSSNTYKKFSQLYVSDLNSWGDKNSNAYKELYVNLSLNNSTIYMEPRITNKEILEKLNEFTETDYANLERYTLLNLNYFADVRFMRPTVLIKK